MPKVDMSADAVTTRLKRVSQLRRLCLSLAAAKIAGEETGKTGAKNAAGTISQSHKPETK